MNVTGDDDVNDNRSDDTWTARVLANLDIDPDQPALISLTDDGVETISRAELRSMIAGAVELIEETGVPEGDPVPALFVTTPDAVALLVAGSVLRRPIAPLGPRLGLPELIACAQRLAGKVLFCGPEWEDVATKVAAEAGKEVVVVGRRRSERELRATATEHDVALYIHTTGTTGIPKQVLAHQGALLDRVRVHGDVLGLGPGDRFVAAGLFHHMAGLGNVCSALANGASLAMFPAFSVDAWRRLAAVQPTHTVMMPALMEMLLAEDAMFLPTLRVIAYGGSPVRPATMRRIQAIAPDADFIQLFGQSEGSPITFLSAEDHRRAAADRPELLLSVGRPAPGVELRLHEPDAAGVGEVWARMPHSFKHDEDGWQRTGDLGRFDAEGYLYLVARKGDMIIRGGENVFPLEVEQTLEAHPDVAEAAVVGKPDRRLGETLKAYLVLADPSRPLDTDALRRWTREQLAGFKVPAEWEVVADLPKNAGGKLIRKPLAERAAADAIAD